MSELTARATELGFKLEPSAVHPGKWDLSKANRGWLGRTDRDVENFLDGYALAKFEAETE
jgi:hypothetical protein